MSNMILRIEKLDKIKRSKRLDAFLISSPSSVKYFSGYFFYFEYGNSPFHLLPAVLMVVPGLEATLIVADNEMGQESFIDPLITIIPYESYTYKKPADPAGDSIKKIHEIIQKNKLGSARIGIEANTFPFSVFKKIREHFQSIEWVDISQDISELRSIKDADEIENIRRAAALSDIGQEAVWKYAKEGMTELELFSLAHRDMEASVGHRIPLMSDLSCGVGTNSGGGMPTGRKMKSGDLVLSDFQPCLNGYWGDSCSTMVVAKATAIQKETFNLVREALEIGIQATKPGVRAHEIDRLMRAHIGHYPHHSGHSVGTAYHEEPRITPYNKTELEPGMLVALEPAIYKEEWGIRLEHLILITSTGSEILTKYRHRLEK
ncbi:MAG TPA: Xaa-Pro peptidase family protein [Puia sp.]|nr:Xaa-Pro peptidase family protein [Puia sp.]